MFLPGEVVEVRDWKATRENPWGGAYMVRVLESRYLAGNPESEFVGRAISGRFEGNQMAFRNDEARYPRKAGE